MKAFKGLVIGIVLAVSIIKLYCMGQYIIEGCKWYNSLSQEEKTEIREVLNNINKPYKA